MIRFRILFLAFACAGALHAAVRGAEPQSARPAAGAASSAPATAQPALPLPASQVVEHASRSVEWYRHITTLQQMPSYPDELILRERLSQTSLTALRLAFDFGHAAAALAASSAAQSAPAGKSTAAQTPSGTPDSTGKPDSAARASGEEAPATGIGGELDQAAEQLAQRIATLQSQQSALDEQLGHAAAKDRAALSAQRGEIAAALNLEREIQSTVAQIERFEESSQSSDSRSSGLASQLAELQRSVPEARRTGGAHGPAGVAGSNALPGSGAASADGSASASEASSASAGAGSAADGSGNTNTRAVADAGTSGSAAARAAPAAANPFRPESAGVISLSGEWFSLHSTRGQLTDAAKNTDALIKETDEVRRAVTQEVRGLAREEIGIGSADTSQLARSRQQLEMAATRFRQLSTLLVPLGEQSVMIEGSRNLLVAWRNSIAARAATVSRYLALRIGVLLGSIAVVLAISEIWRRATFRYLHDMRRRAQFLALRRVAVGVALTLVIVFGLVSEVGSVATYAGLITAGLAVALQNVILAVVAYFFLIGRYGVRVGDRITLAGVTGRVVDIGLVRIYLMELTGPQLRSSGRMVVLSNAVLFQPAALFKQMPGGDYSWHTISLTLAAAADVQSAQSRLSQAADAVYEHYRPAIEQQHAALQRFIDFETAMPRPEIYVRLTDKGLECTVRYPVEPSRAVSIDQQMLAAVHEAQGKAPELQLVSGPLLSTEG